MNTWFTEKWSLSDFSKFVLPSILGIITISMYMMVDAVFVSRFAGPAALAGVNIIMPVFSLCFAVGIMMAAGASSIVGIELGRGKRSLANRHFSLALYFLLAVAVFIVVFFLGFGTERTALLLGASETLLPYSTAYLEVFNFGISAVIIQVFFEYFIRLDGKPIWAFFSTIASGMTNVALDYWLIVHLDMGVTGAGIASTAGIFVAVSIGTWYFLFKSTTLKLTRPIMDAKFLSMAMANGASEMVTELSSGIKMLVFNLVVIQYAGDTGVAAMAILINIYFLLSSFHIGLGMGISPVISMNAGSQNHAKIREIVSRTIYFALAASLTVFGLAMFWGNHIIALFTRDQAVALYATQGLKIFAFVFLVNWINILTSNFFTALGNGKISALISFLNSFVFTLTFVKILPPTMGLSGVWAATPLAETLTTLLSVYFVLRYKKTLRPDPGAKTMHAKSPARSFRS